MSVKYCLKVFKSNFTRSKDIKVIIIIYKKLLFLHVHVLISFTIQYMYIHVYCVHVHVYLYMYMYMYMLRAIWEFAQSADCVTQTEDPQNASQSADWHAFCRLLKLLNHKFTTTTNTSLVILIYFYQLLKKKTNKN